MKDKFHSKYRISSTRLRMWNYSQNGYYFVTICTKNNVNYFGGIKNSVLSLNKIGQIAQGKLVHLE